ncbi:uncharacterized protein LOC113315723 [Papaver somniferum]|uniref:uncharacterized protein LOC113315723 n=1 Tax=Papaver somniferum TaxID=3469 RepID=UPI000E6F986A|nr:uncharacterized protein LOC113315723 [Papaver somniferum]
MKWAKRVWNNFVHPSIASNVWKLVRNITATDDNMKKRKFQLASRCIFCKKEEETREHILWYCNFSEIVWKWLGGIFSFRNPRSFGEILQYASQKSPAVKEVWILTSFIAMKELWFLRNECLYDNGKCDALVIKNKILKTISESDIRMKAMMWNIQYDLQVLKSLGLKSRKVKSLIVKEVFFTLPLPGQILLCCDGASRGNPGTSRYGIVGRDSNGGFIIPISGGLGISTNYYAEIYAVIIAGEWAIQNDFFNIVFRTNSMAVIHAFINQKLPWFAIARWRKKKGKGKAAVKEVCLVFLHPFFKRGVDFEIYFGTRKYFSKEDVKVLIANQLRKLKTGIKKLVGETQEIHKVCDEQTKDKLVDMSGLVYMIIGLELRLNGKEGQGQTGGALKLI